MNSYIETLNLQGENFLHFAWPMLWQSSLLIVLLFALEFLLRRRVRPAIRYALWLVVLVKLLLPPSLALPTSPRWWLGSTSKVVPPKPTTSFIVTYGDQIAPRVPLQNLPTPAPIRLKLSAAGWVLVVSTSISFGLLAWLLIRWRQVSRQIQGAAVSENLDSLFQEATSLLELRRANQPRVTEDSMSPAVCGLFRPVILMPRSLIEKLSPDQLRAVLLHELIHLRRGDVWVNCAQTLLQIIYWWHPLLWLANARIRRVREEAVDDAVMLALRDSAETYAPTLLEVAKLAFNRPLASLGLVGILESRSALRQRIERLINFHAPQKAGITFVSLLGILAFTAIALPMGEAPLRETNFLAPVATDNPLPDPKFQDYKRIKLESDFLIADAASLAAVFPSLIQTRSPLTINSNEMADVKTKLTQIGARTYTDYEHLRFQQFSGGRFRWLIASDSKNGVTYRVKEVGDKKIVWGANVQWTAYTLGWTAMNFNAVPWVEGDSLRCEMELATNHKTNAPQHAEVIIPLGGGMLWATSDETSPGKAQIVFLQYPGADDFNDGQSQSDMPRDGNTTNLETRIFKVDTNAFLAGLIRIAKLSTSESTKEGLEARRAAFRTYFKESGVDLPTKNISFDDRTGALIVIATSQEMTSVEEALRLLTAPQGGQTNSNIEASNLVQDGRLLFEQGKLDEAEVKLKKALAIAPENKAAAYYYSLIEERKLASRNPGTRRVIITTNEFRVGTRRLDSAPSPDGSTTNLTGKGRQVIVNKLNRIRLDSVQYDNLPLSEVIRDLRAKSMERDSEKRGINFIIKPEDTESHEAVDMNSISITINPPLKNVRLADVLDVILKVANQPIKISYEDYGVIFLPRTKDDSVELFTRVFKVDPNTLLSELEKAGMNLSNPPEARSVDRIQSAVRDYLANAGVDLTPPKAIFFNDRQGTLLVRATSQDLDIIEKAIQVVNMVPPQINIRIKFIGVSQSDTKSLGFDWYLGNSLMQNGAMGGQENFHGILTAEQTRTVLEEIKKREGIKLLNEGQITTLDGRQAQLQMADLRTIATNINPLALQSPGVVSTNLYQNVTLPFGTMLDVIPNVSADGFTIELSLIASMTRFQGYEKPTNSVTAYVDGKKQSVFAPLPKFENLQMTNRAIVYDGQTVVMGSLTDGVERQKDKTPVLGDLPFLGRLFRSEENAAKRKTLLVFITTTLVDPTGHPTHSQDELPFAEKSIPPQARR